MHLICYWVVILDPRSLVLQLLWALILCLLKPSFCSFEIISNSQTLLVYSIKGIFIITIMPMEYKETETQGEERAEEEWGEVEKR